MNNQLRQIVLDTETTGLEPSQGHRIIEIGCVELINRRKTENTFHQYLNPEREIEDGAYDVHGLSTDFLSDKPLFKDIAQDFIEFIRDAELIIHNAPFDIAFLNAELNNLGKKWGKIDEICTITDTLKTARDLHPGQKNSLDALCGRYSVDNSSRNLHGALLDARILLDVYLAMTGGQTSLLLDEDEVRIDSIETSQIRLDTLQSSLPVIYANDDELAAHDERLEDINKKADGECIWLKLKDGLH
jgi:DNA polymerase-3 subunit epsilon